MTNLKIYGASGHGKVLADVAELMRKYHISFVDDLKVGFFYDKPIFKVDEIAFDDLIIIAIGENEVRKYVVENIGERKFINLIHPKSAISISVKMGHGISVMAGVSVNASSVIGNHVILNTNCSVDHDCVIGDFVHISPGANLAGNVTVGECAQIGIGASIIQGIRVGKGALIGAGSVIIDNVPDFAVVVGVPGKVIKYRK
jgi:sugar O-acyltransferase (sialic acid O-acetyltransferase NeuD family)